MTAAYLRILIHNMNNSLFPDADPSSVTWTGPPPEIVTVQSLLYGSLATSLFAAFIATLGKQWISRYLRKQGGSAAEKSRDRQRKLEGFKKWYFQFAIESLPVMLQMALLLLGCALTLYLWTISRTVAGVILTFTLFGVTSYTFFTFVATLHYNCPYQTPLSILIRTAIQRLAQIDSVFVRFPRRLISSLPSINDVRRLVGHILSGLCRGLGRFPCNLIVEDGDHIAQAVVVAPPIFEDTLGNLEVFGVDSSCVWWVLGYTTDPDVISSTARFAADIIWHPKIARNVSLDTLADLFFDCFVGEQVVSGRLGHASAIGMALASALSTRLVLEPFSRVLGEFCERLQEGIWGVFPPDPTFLLVVEVLKILAEPVQPEGGLPIRGPRIRRQMVDPSSTTTKLWLSRVMLQHLWRWKLLNALPTLSPFHPFPFLGEGCMIDGDDTPTVLKTTCFLAVAIFLGLEVDRRDLYPPDTAWVLSSVLSMYFTH